MSRPQIESDDREEDAAGTQARLVVVLVGLAADERYDARVYCMTMTPTAVQMSSLLGTSSWFSRVLRWC